jgi:hypothetical protein
MTTTAGPDSRQLVSVAGRAFVAGALLAVMATGQRELDVALVAVVVIAALAFDGRHLLTLKNFFLAYSLLVFGVGAGVLHLAPDSVFADLAWYTVAFLVGYAIGSLLTGERRSGGPEPNGSGSSWTDGRGRVPPVAVEAALLVLIGLNLLFLAVQLFRYGIVGYYRGQALLDQFLTYGQASAGGGAEQIVRFLLRFSAVGLIVLYAQACFDARTRTRYRYPVALLVLFPILALRRYDAVVGALTALAVYGCERRVIARQGRQDDDRAKRVRARARTGLGLTRAAALGGAVVSAVLAALAIGLLRQGFHADTTGASPAETGSLPILTSELSPVQAYGDIRANIGVLGHTRGRTIMLPLVLKMVPRAWYPNKPLNSGAYYMSTLRPAEFDAGFALPPTFFGDAYLSFGFGGALAACLLLGVVVARLDRAYKDTILRRLPLFLLVWANFFSIMRDPISESLAGVLLTLTVWLVARHLLSTDVDAAPGNARAPAPPRSPLHQEQPA